MARTAQQITVRITRHPRSNQHKRVRVETARRAYYVDYAEPFPTEDEVRELWRTERKAFEPYYGF